MTKLFKNMKLLKEIGLLNSYLAFIFSGMLHAFFNAMLTIISMEVFAFYSGICSTKRMSFQDFIAYVVFVPICTSLIILLAFTVLFTLFSGSKLFSSLNIISKGKNKSSKEIAQGKLIKEYNKYILVFSLLGTVLYALFAVITYYTLINMPSVSEYIANQDNLFWYALIVGLIFGMLWNLANYNSMKRLNWSKVFTCMGENKNKETSFKCLIRQILFEVLAICMVIGQIIYAYFFLLSSNNTIILLQNENSLTWLNIIVAIISTLIFTYVKAIVKLQFSKESDKIMFPDFEKLLG